MDPTTKRQGILRSWRAIDREPLGFFIYRRISVGGSQIDVDRISGFHCNVSQLHAFKGQSRGNVNGTIVA
jgi:hypothetical protein